MFFRRPLEPADFRAKEKANVAPRFSQRLVQTFWRVLNLNRNFEREIKEERRPGEYSIDFTVLTERFSMSIELLRSASIEPRKSLYKLGLPFS